MSTSRALLLLSLLCTAFAVYSYECSESVIVLQLDQPMTAVTCSIGTGGFIRVSPALPAGLKYVVANNNNGGQIVTISGTPRESLAPRNFYIGFNLWMAVINISIFGTPSLCTYGFDSMTLYTELPMEPIPIQCNTAISQFTVSPQLPEGMVLDDSTGVISGTLQSAGNSVVYTVTATNPQGSTSTTFSFNARDYNEMTQAGMTGCYWSEITECLTPDFSFFYSKPAQICQIVSNIQFTDNYDYQSWPGLDSRFVDYFAAYFYGYIVITAPGTYQFAMNADDGAMLYIDDVTSPVIDVPGCWDTTASESTHSQVLSRGRHLVIIRYFEYNDGATVYLKMGSTDLGIPLAVVTANQLRVGGRGPTFIHYDFVGGYAGTSLPVHRPELNSGAPYQWQISSLPQGLAFNTQNGYISGIPSSASSGIYTVTATGVNGVASTTVRIVITQSPLSGFLAKYYKIIDSNHCVYPSLKGNVVSLKSIQVDNDINHPETPATYLWPNTPQDFTTYYYVEWEGYLLMETIGNWKLRLTCNSGCKLFGADDQLLISNWGCHDFIAVEATYPVSSNGYYYFRVEYAQSTGPKGIIFEWQAPAGGMEVVPANKIFHIPTGALSYKYELAHYYRGAPIDDNTPVAFSVTNLNGFQIHPPLPTGLSMNANGIISGTPLEDQILSYYTITAQSATGVETTVIGFDVNYVVPPSSMTLMMSGLTVTSTINLVPLVTMPAITISLPSGVTVNEFSISPALPEGMNFSSTTGSITGKPLVSSTQKTYTISAFNNGGSAFVTFQLSISGCKGISGGQSWENSFYLLYLSTGTATFSVQQSGSTVQCAIDSMGSDGNAQMTTCSKVLTAGNQAVFCVPPNAANKIHVSCTDSYGCYWQIRREDGNRFPTKFEYHPTDPQPYINTYDFPSALTPLTSLELSSTTITAISGYDLSTITISPNGCFKSFSVNPSLGAYYDIPLMLPRLSGIIYGAGTKTYTITATGDAGSASAILTVNFVECSAEAGLEAVTFSKITTFYGSEESYVVQNSAGETLLTVSNLNDYSTDKHVLCMPSGKYDITLKDQYGDGWSSGSSLRVSGSDGNLISSFEFTNYSSSKNVELTITVVVPESTNWKGIIDGKVGRNWNTKGFDHSSWSEYTSGVIGQWTENTIYFIHRFEVDDMKQYPVLEFGIFFKDAIVVYLNGAQVYSRNIGTTINHNTLASASYDDYYLRVGSAPGYKLIDGENIFAVEVHRSSSTQGDIHWKGYIKLLQGTCITRIDSGYITESSHYNKDSETAAQAWDRNVQTQWVEGGLPAWTIYSYNFDRTEWVNKLVIGSNLDNASLDPTVVSVYGSLDGVTWTPITTVTDKAMFSVRKEIKEFWMLDHLNSYEKYKVELSESASDVAKVAISYLDLQACRLVYCTRDNDWPGTLAGDTVTIDCAEGFIGERYRKCNDEEINPTWLEADEKECRSTNPPKKTAYIDFVIAMSNVTSEVMLTGGADSLRSVVSTVAGVQESAVDVWKFKDITNTYSNPTMPENDRKIAVYVRITIPQEGAGDVLTKVTSSVNEIQTSLNQFYSAMFGSTVCQFYTMPELNEPRNLNAVSITLIVVLVIVVLILAVIVGFYLWVRLKNKGKKDGAKQLRSGVTKKTLQKANEKTSKV